MVDRIDSPVQAASSWNTIWQVTLQPMAEVITDVDSELAVTRAADHASLGNVVDGHLKTRQQQDIATYAKSTKLGFCCP